MNAPSRLTDAVRTHLELHARAALRAAPAPVGDVELTHEREMSVARYRERYALIGARWHWRDRLAWSDRELGDYLESSSVQNFTLRVDSETAGWFELRRLDDDSVEIVYFGLAHGFIGRGLGGWLLTRACEEAFTLGATRIVLNTCTLDAPQALPNYLARGFTIVREERYLAEL